jgi:hypothetical protein
MTQDSPFAEGAKGRPEMGEVGVVGEKSSAGRQDVGATDAEGAKGRHPGFRSVQEYLVRG